MDLHERFEQFNGEYLKFELVKEKRCERPDLHALLILNDLESAPRYAISDATHDEIWLDFSPEILNMVNDDVIIELIRCGVRYDEEEDSLCMFA